MSFGEMVLKEILEECQKEGWVPLLVIRTKDRTSIPSFKVQDEAVKFAKRNIAKGELWGTTQLTLPDVEKIQKEWIDGKKWHFEQMEFPKFIGNNGTIDVECYSFIEKPDVYGNWGNGIQRKFAISE
jgi:hypothetical protein